jgi:RNA polymerase sigma-70 factor (ECF subfamily)
MFKLSKRKRHIQQQESLMSNDQRLLFKQFCSENHERLFQWALRCTHFDQQEAEDILTGLYTMLLEGKAEQIASEEWLVWSFGALRKLSLSRQRKQNWRQALLQKWFKQQTSSQRVQQPDESFEQEEIKNKRIKLVNLALNQLSARQKEIIILAIYEELTLNEIAQVLELGLGSVRTHYHRAKQKLHAYLSEHFVNDLESKTLSIKDEINLQQISKCPQESMVEL